MSAEENKAIVRRAKKGAQPRSWWGRMFGSRQWLRLPTDWEGEMDDKRIIKERAEGPIYFSRPVRADGRTLRELREERGLSVSELARLSGVSTSTIYKLQRGPASRTWAERNYTLKRLAEALEVEVERLEA